jgi:hypothetical protein
VTRAQLGLVDQAVIIADNAALNKTSSEFCLPIVTFSTVESDGVRESEYVECLLLADILPS